MNLKSNLRSLLDLKGISISTLSLKAKVPKSSVADWVSGSTPKNLDSLKRVADFLSVSVDQLLYGDVTESKALSDGIIDGLTSDRDGFWSGNFQIKIKPIGKKRGE